MGPFGQGLGCYFVRGKHLWVFSRGSNIMAYIIKDHSDYCGFTFKDRSVSKVHHCSSAEFNQQGAQRRLITI